MNEKSILKLYKDFNIDMKSNRWEQGIPHHPMSTILMKHLMAIDFNFYDDHFCWKMGGDGDNGENLMYELDHFFELQDKLKGK